MPKNRGADAQLLTMHELAAYLHLDEATVAKLVMQGKIPSLQVDRQWRFKRAAIDEWIEQQLVGDDENFADVPDGMKLPLDDLLPDQAIITNLRARPPVGVIEERAPPPPVGGGTSRGASAPWSSANRWRRPRWRAGSRFSIPAPRTRARSLGRSSSSADRGKASASARPTTARPTCSSCSASSTTGSTCRSSAGSPARCATPRRSPSCAR